MTSNFTEISLSIKKNGYFLIKDFLEKQDIINLKSLIKRTIFKNKRGKYIFYREKCIWIDPKLGIK